MRVAHLLRKYDPAEWGGTESALHQLATGLRSLGIESVVFCPRLANGAGGFDTLTAAGCRVRRFRACLPVWGLPRDQRRQQLAVGGNLISFDLFGRLWREPGLDVVHAHALGRLAGIGRTVARCRRLPFVVTVHGGLYDLPADLHGALNGRRYRGVEWGKVFGWLVRARQVVRDADAILTCNPREAALIRERHPGKRVVVQPHGVPVALYRADRRELARAAYPALRDDPLLVSLGRIDPVKNQRWLVERMPGLLQRHPRLRLALVGPGTDAAYASALDRRIAELRLSDRVLRIGRLPPADPRLIGLLQAAQAVVLPSVSETFGLVILEAWAAGTPVIASRTSGALALVEHGRSGWLFDLAEPDGFDRAVDTVLADPAVRTAAAAAGRRRVESDYDAAVIAGQVGRLYGQLVEEHHAAGHPA